MAEDKTPKPLTEAELKKLNDDLAKEGQTTTNDDDFSKGGDHIVYANENDEADNGK